MFQKLIVAPSEATPSHLGLDKRKLQTTDRFSNTDPNSEIVQPKKSTQDSPIWLWPQCNNIALQACISYKTVSTSHIKSILMSQALSYGSKAKTHIPSPMEHASGSAEILIIVRSAGAWLILTSQTLPQFSFWCNLAYKKISRNLNFCNQKFISCMSMSPTLAPFKSFIRN